MIKKVCLPLKYHKGLEATTEESDEGKSSISFDAEKRIIFIDGEIYENDGILFEQVFDIISEYVPEGLEDAKPEPITKLGIHINSEGGSVDAGLNIVSQIEMLKESGTEIEVIIKEKACSMAFLIAIVGSSRKIRRYARLMVHPSWFMFSGEAPITISALREFTKSSDESWNVFSEIILKYTKFSKKELHMIYKDGKDYTMESEQALNKGCVDIIL